VEKPIYRFGMLRTDRSEEADRHNAELLGPNTLGVEVTRPELASRCGLGNIDPQHEQGVEKSSAAEAALVCPLPPTGTTIVTIRFDKDAIVAMAVLALRAEGKEQKIDKFLLNWVGALDRGTYDLARINHPEIDGFFHRDVTDALNTIAKDGDGRWKNLVSKVRATAQILTGEITKEEIRKIASQRKRLSGDFSNQVQMYGEVAYIHAVQQYEAARNWGNPRFPVAVVFDPERKTESGGVQERWCIVRQEQPRKVFDRVGCEVAINEAEAKKRGLSLEQLAAESLLWGGTKNLLVSPQGAGFGTELSKEEIMAVVQKHYESGVVT